MRFLKLAAAILILIGMNVAISCADEPHPTPSSTSTLTRHVFDGPDGPLDSTLPKFENRLETEHFVLKWTNKSTYLPDNIKDPQIIKETADYLETAWAKYAELFGRTPYIPPGKDKVEVIFRDIDCYGFADPPDGPIELSAGAWRDPKSSGIRRSTSAHELFHKLQYAYGYKTKWKPQQPYKWFSEGTAAWAEVYVWGRVSRVGKVDDIFKDSSMDLYEADDRAMPFWIYFVHGNEEHANNALMRKFFEACERLQDENLALKEVVEETYGPLDRFFQDFKKERLTGFWRGPCETPYSCILGPDGNDLVQEVTNYLTRKTRNQKTGLF